MEGRIHSKQIKKKQRRLFWKKKKKTKRDEMEKKNAEKRRMAREMKMSCRLPFYITQSKFLSTKPPCLGAI